MKVLTRPVSDPGHFFSVLPGSLCRGVGLGNGGVPHRRAFLSEYRLVCCSAVLSRLFPARSWAGSVSVSLAEFTF